MELREHQKDAVNLLGSGKILYGEVGTGKTATALGYYVKAESDRDIYVITTAKKRNSLDWEKDAASFGISVDPTISRYGKIKVDSWNNVKDYVGVKDAFFVFDEQRLVGSGAWVKSFLKIAKNNHWILLSGTPGDTWLDYAPIFIANGWYKNFTHFKREHVVYVPHISFPKVSHYVNTGLLNKYRNNVLVEMPYKKHTIPHFNYLPTGYDRELWDKAVKDRWNPYTDEPIMGASELFRVMRRISNEHTSRLETIKDLLKVHDRLIIFYNFNYELAILRTLSEVVECGEYNGIKKDPIPETGKWVYLVQYTAGAEGWNCISTNALVNYSLTYSYKLYKQSHGRIDRLNTPYTDLYYYVLVSDAPIDVMVKKALQSKKNFNESALSSRFGG